MQPALFEEPTLTVDQLSAGIGGAISRAFPDEVWVRGEIVDINRASSGHVYFNLTGGGACIPVTLWAPDRLVVNAVLRRAGGAVRMTDGTEVRIRAQVSWYPKRGTVQLRMLSIDTSYTLGRLAAERERLLRRLEADGLLRRQRSLALPDMPLLVGLVTSDGSAAAADFMRTLDASGLGWRVALADARVQGPEAAASLVAALGALGGAVDVVCIVRGGGARTDLAAFDLEPVARAVAACPVPVLTGIGHETDVSVADLVAHQSFKTPTACATYLVERARSWVDRAEAAWVGIGRAAERALDGAGATLHRRAGRAAGACRHHLRAREDRLAQATERLVGRPPRLLDGAERALEARRARVDALDPARVLARGWSITHDGDGRLVRSPAAVRPGSALVTTLAEGVVHSRVSDE